jgi:hypothetical protein
MANPMRICAALFIALLLSACSTSNGTGLPLPDFGDGIDPVIAVAGITNGSTVSGTVAVSGAATDNIGVTAFTLSIDGTQVASAPNGVLAYSWNTTTATNAAHTLVFSASDAKGNTATTTINVTVNNTGGGGGGGGTGTVSGTVFAPNGTDPVANALVFVEDKSGSAVGDPPTEPYLKFAYSNASGVFNLTEVPTGLQSLKFVKGAFSKVISIDVQEGDNVLSAAQTTLPTDAAGGAGDMLVVTGSYDVIENVLAKLGLGDVDVAGQLILGTETFKLVDGDSSLDDGTYPNFDPFFLDGSNYEDYRTIFLNCGIDGESAFLDNANAVADLKAWVENGGRLYCTDWSYNFVEQLWPERIDFDAAIGDGDGLTATPEERDFAKTGPSIETLNCQIEDAGLAAWMSGIGAALAGDTFETVDWLPAWVRMDAIGTGVKLWADGTPPSDVERPMAVTFAAEDGTVLFSSFHTEETPSTDIKPQERVLQYLIFEVL